MNCSDVKYQLPEYVRNTLSHDDAEGVARHLATCDACRSDAEDVASLFSLMKKEEVWTPTENYFKTLLPRIHARRFELKTRSIPGWATRVALPAAAAVLCIFLATRITPGVFMNREIDEKTVFSQYGAEDLEQAVERQSTAAVIEPAPVIVNHPFAVTKEDKEVLKVLLQEEPRQFLASEPVEWESQSTLQEISENEADQLISFMNQRTPVN